MADDRITAADRRISGQLQSVAKAVDQALATAAGRRVSFSLFVWTEGRSQYVSNVQRDDVVRALEETLARWREGMPDVPAHEIQ